MHPVLKKLFDALEAQGLRWALLRVPDDLAAPTGDVDILVALDDAAALRAVAVASGFVSLPGWDAPPNLLLTHYDLDTDRWLLLDIDTTVGFRRPRGLRSAAATGQVLARREVRDGVAVPAPADLFWLLLLHCLLDKGGVEERYRARLQELAPGAAESLLGRTLLEGAADDRALAAAVSAGDWEVAKAHGEEIVRSLRSRQGRSGRLRALTEDAVRRGSRAAMRPHRRGANLALLGPNGVGKSTVAAGLQDAVPFESRVIHMGLWKAAGGPPARQVAEVALRPASLWLRYARARYHQLLGRLVIFDRYVYEAYLPSQPPLLRAKRLYHAVLAHSVPPAQAAVVLDVPGRLAYGRKQENPPDELESERRFYAQLASSMTGVEVVDASHDADVVGADVAAALWRLVSHRWAS